MMLDKIKVRLAVGTFDEIMRFAILMDLSPLKVICIRFAEDPQNSGIRHMYEARQLSPEVEFELQAIWAAPSEDTHQHQFF